MRKILATVLLLCINPFNTYAFVQSTDIVYQGAFKLPHSGTDTLTFDTSTIQSGKGLAYNPSGNGGAGSLYVKGHIYYSTVGEISIPTLYTGDTLASVPVASILQAQVDITEGNRNLVGCNNHAAYGGGGSMQLSALAVYGGKLIGGLVGTYNANSEVCYSTFTHDLNVTTASFLGMYGFDHSPYPNVSAGYVNNYMGAVPSERLTSLGGPVVTGSGLLSVVTQTSSGPSLFSFDPSSLSGSNTVLKSATALLYYPQDHQILGVWGEATTQYSSIADKFTGVVIPKNSNSVLFFGRHGSGTSCYGPATSVESEYRTNAEILALGSYNCSGEIMNGLDGDSCCWDTTSHDKGTHSYPYRYQVTAYNIADLEAVKNGTKYPWEPIPYATWELPLKWNSIGTDGFDINISGVAYDETNQRLFVLQAMTDVVHVFRINPWHGKRYPYKSIIDN